MVCETALPSLMLAWLLYKIQDMNPKMLHERATLMSGDEIPKRFLQTHAL